MRRTAFAIQRPPCFHTRWRSNSAMAASIPTVHRPTSTGTAIGSPSASCISVRRNIESRSAYTWSTACRLRRQLRRRNRAHSGGPLPMLIAGCSRLLIWRRQIACRARSGNETVPNPPAHTSRSCTAVRDGTAFATIVLLGTRLVSERRGVHHLKVARHRVLASIGACSQRRSRPARLVFKPYRPARGSSTFRLSPFRASHSQR